MTTTTAQFAAGDRAIWTGLKGLFERPVEIRKVRVGYLVILGETPADGEVVYDIHDPVVKGVIFGIPAAQLRHAEA